MSTTTTGRRPTTTATSSSRRSTTICPSIHSSSGSSPATSTPRTIRWPGWLPATPLPPSWIIPEPKQQRSAGGATVTKQDDGSALISGTNPPIETLVFTYTTDLKDIKAIRIEALSHPSLVKNGPGRAANGNFALTDLKIVASPLPPAGKTWRDGPLPVTVKLKNPRATFEQ